MSTDVQRIIERFPWPRFKELADHAGVDVTLAEELLKPELNQWIGSLGLDRPDMSRFGQLLSDRLQQKVNAEGLSIPEAALYMGMTEGSFRRLFNLQLPALPIRTGSNGESRLLKGELDRFADSYLPSFKTWNTRTNLLREFFLTWKVVQVFRSSRSCAKYNRVSIWRQSYAQIPIAIRTLNRERYVSLIGNICATDPTKAFVAPASGGFYTAIFKANIRSQALVSDC